MTYQRLPYADAETAHEMALDCQHAGDHLHLPGQRVTRDVESARTDLFEDYAAPAAGPLDIPDSLARMAAGLELHFD